MKKTIAYLLSIPLTMLLLFMLPVFSQAAEDNCEHNLQFISEDMPTCTNPGMKEHYECTICYKLFADENAQTEVTAESLIIPPTSHTLEEEHSWIVLKEATLSKDGLMGYPCVECNEVQKTSVIPKVGKITLSFSSKTYNGKVQKPIVQIYDRKGNKLYNGTEGTEFGGDYRIAIPKLYNYGKTVGRYTVHITFINRYSGSVIKTFDIKPKTTSIIKFTSGKKRFTVRWKKQASQTTGYQILYSTSKSFKNPKKVTVSNRAATSKTITKLGAKKKYYVKVRTYKKAKYNGKTVNIYSAWSNAKSVKTK